MTYYFVVTPCAAYAAKGSFYDCQKLAQQLTSCGDFACKLLVGYLHPWPGQPNLASKVRGGSLSSEGGCSSSRAWGENRQSSPTRLWS